MSKKEMAMNYFVSFFPKGRKYLLTSSIHIFFNITLADEDDDKTVPNADVLMSS
jgi:hypothetical protein